MNIIWLAIRLQKLEKLGIGGEDAKAPSLLNLGKRIAKIKMDVDV